MIKGRYHEEDTELLGFKRGERSGPPMKTVRVYINKDIEFNVDVYDEHDTCGWLLEEVRRRYIQEMEKVREEIGALQKS